MARSTWTLKPSTATKLRVAERRALAEGNYKAKRRDFTPPRTRVKQALKATVREVALWPVMY